MLAKYLREQACQNVEQSTATGRPMQAADVAQLVQAAGLQNSVALLGSLNWAAWWYAFAKWMRWL